MQRKASRRKTMYQRPAIHQSKSSDVVTVELQVPFITGAGSKEAETRL